jgi:hypothetical protein
MRSLSFILALGFLVTGATLAGPSDSGPPGIGTFVYSGSQILSAAPPVIFAARREEAVQ